MGTALSPSPKEFKGPDGKFLSAAGEDAFGHAQLGGVAPVITTLINANLGCKCHWAVPDYLQRSARHLASMTDVEQAYAFHGMAFVSIRLKRNRSITSCRVRRSCLLELPAAT